MKTLLILRHGKAAWKEEGMDDHDRPLKKRGQRDAERVGHWLLQEQLLPEKIVSSTARRARDTAGHVAEVCGIRTAIELRPELYLAPPATYWENLERLDDELQRVMVVGHNPGLEDMVQSLAGIAHEFPTAALAQFELDTDYWRTARSADARLIHLWRPKEDEEM